MLPPSPDINVFIHCHFKGSGSQQAFLCQHCLQECLWAPCGLQKLLIKEKAQWLSLGALFGRRGPAETTKIKVGQRILESSRSYREAASPQACHLFNWSVESGHNGQHSCNSFYEKAHNTFSRVANLFYRGHPTPQ